MRAKLARCRDRWSGLAVAASMIATGCGGDGDVAFTDDGFGASGAAEQPASQEFFMFGPHRVVTHDAPDRWFFHDHLPPSDTRIHMPADAGTYPALVVLPCLVCGNDWQDEIFKHVASHGFVVAVPKLHALTDVMFPGQLAELDAESAFASVGWVYAQLDEYLQENTELEVRVVPESLTVVGMSSGGKAAWLLARDYPLPIGNLIGLAPVDSEGDPFGFAPQPRITLESLDLGIPTLIMGAGFDPVRANSKFPACAPEGENHEQFYASSVGPAYHVVSELSGHVDMFDQRMQKLLGMACPSEADSQVMRDLIKGVVTAFLRQQLNGEVGFERLIAEIGERPGFLSEWK